MNCPVVALALDALSPVLLETWMAQGQLPNFQKLRQQGAYGRLHKPEEWLHENSWWIFLQGCAPRVTGQSNHQHYLASRYQYQDLPVYRMGQHPPFYQLYPQTRFALFDLPHAPVVDGSQGMQISGWGVEENQCQQLSSPPELIREITQRYGAHPFFAGPSARPLDANAQVTVTVFRNPSLYDPAALKQFQRDLIQGIRQRTAIIIDLLEREPWDLLLAAYAELHVAGHLLWHCDQPHPLNQWGQSADSEPDRLLEIAQEVDAALGELLAALPENARLVLFSTSGMRANFTDLPSTLFLPEFLFRWQWGDAALAVGNTSQPPPPPADHYPQHWKDEIWALRTPLGESLLESPQQQEQQHDPLDWNPQNWYRLLWPQMRAFSIPSFSHGLIRLNVIGRDGQGLIALADYEAECQRLTKALLRITDARSGRLLVKQVLRTALPTLGGPDPQAPPADLMVIWDPEAATTDVADSPDVGRIGPAPYFRSGGHAANGFCLACGPGIPANSHLPENAQIPDLTASLLTMMGQAVPPHIEGRSWWPLSS